MNENAVTRWFGNEFTQLHPLLQQLHLNGGTLQGKVDIEFGKGIAGWIGRRLASKLGIPVDCPQSNLKVDIHHQNNKLYWSRTFASADNPGTDKMQSVFEPKGQWPKGYWVEQTGKIKLILTVDIIDQGWYWRGLKTKLGWLTIPQWLLPRSKAWKRIKEEQYEFNVEFSLLGLGLLLRYHGALGAVITSK